MEARRLKVFTLIDRYLPGFRHGGPIRTIAAMVEQLDDVEFWIFTADRDAGDVAPYPAVERDAWGRQGNANVWYASSGRERIRDVAEALRAAAPDLIYSNSLFSRVNLRALAARRVGLLPRLPFLLAPRGELSPGALRLKHAKKAGFLHVAARLGLFRDVVWHASTEMERAEIAGALSRHGAGPADVGVAKNLFRMGPPRGRQPKTAGRARFVFLSRVSRKKNLAFGIERLAAQGGPAELTVYGPVEDAAYLDECRGLAARSGVPLTYGGELSPDEVPAAFAAHDFFLFPTLGENFGHVIVEALATGCPVVLSDRTPWVGLEAFPAGWTIPLASIADWERVLSVCVAMTAEEHAHYVAGARDAAVKLGQLDESRVVTRALLGRVASMPPLLT